MAKKTKPPKPATPEQEPEQKGKPVFDQVDSADENVYPFKEAVPEGFDFGEFKPLKKRDFKEEYLFYEYRAAEAEIKAAKFKELAEESKKLGSGKQRQATRRLLKLREQIAALSEHLGAQGVDVEALLSEAE